MHDEFAVPAQLTLRRQSESVGRTTARVALMRSIGTALWIALAGGLMLPASGVQAQNASSAVKLAQATSPQDQPDAPRRVQRPLRRVPIYPPREVSPEQEVYPHFNPGPDAVRDCTANYVQEARPSGTVIVPRMHCYWRPR
jgi:hypothetical protein